MKYSKIFQYAYLVFAALFIYDAVTKYINKDKGFYLSLGLAALAIFMFFFKRRFAKKYENSNTSK